ncbi:FkbM family methyltransferase [Crenothrix sp. D3]|jgi:FkbM family methyltransferase|nr:FkbM family methyltransferase [Crenothrix sp. D3]
MNELRVIRRPAPFVIVASGHGTLIVNRNDYQMIDDQRGYGVGFQIFNSSYFDPEEMDLVLSLLNLRKQHFGDGVFGIDCGANIGVHTIEWARHMVNWGKVIAFEAQERIFYALAGNIAINNCFNAQVIHAAVGANEGTLAIPTVDYNQPSSFGSLELKQSTRNEFIGQVIDYSPDQMKTIKMISIDSLALPRVDFIKIDVEGMELDVLEGAKKTIEKFKPQMLIETIKVDKQSLMQHLKDWDYKCYQVGINILAVHCSDPSNKVIQITPIPT